MRLNRPILTTNVDSKFKAECDQLNLADETETNKQTPLRCHCCNWRSLFKT